MRRCLILAVVIVSAALPLLATEPNPSARQRELIEKLLDATESGNTAKSMMDAMFAQIEKQFVEQAGQDSDEIEEAKEMFSLFRERVSQIDIAGLMREASVRIYAKYFTESELVDLTTFYTSSTGRKSIEVMPHLIREGMEAGVEYVSPKISEVMAQVREDQEKKRPWRRTMAQIRSVSTALEAYALDHEDRYPSGDYASLKELLSPTYLNTFPEKDVWGHPYAYVGSPDGSSYRFVSSGADGNFEWDSRRIAAKSTKEESDEGPETRYRERLDEDIIFENGSFLQAPLQAKPKNDD
jgi:hypothetical protein